MNMKLNFHISLWLVIFCFKLSSQYYFAARTGYCTFSVSNQASNEEKPKKAGYYWRDYNHGYIPCDALPAGKTKEHPVIYVGQVYISKFSGLYVANIFPGKRTVLVNVNGTLVETSENIQILCSEEPNKFLWNYLTTTNISTTGALGLSYPIGGLIAQNRDTTVYIARSAFEEDVYVGCLTRLINGVEYTDAAGQGQKSNKYELLLFRSKDQLGKQENEPKIGFAEDVKAPNYGNLVPSFYKRLKIGGFSATCTNQKPQSEAGYYWRQQIIDQIPEDAVLAGVDKNNISYYVGQAIARTKTQNIYFTSQIPSKDKELTVGGYPFGNNIIIYGRGYIKVLCSENTDTLHWIKTNTDDVKNLKKNWVIGGALQNGTQFIVGRGGADGYGPLPGRVAMSNYPILETLDSYSSIESRKYELLWYKEPASAKQGIFKNIWRAFGVAIKVDFCL